MTAMPSFEDNLSEAQRLAQLRSEVESVVRNTMKMTGGRGMAAMHNQLEQWVADGKFSHVLYFAHMAVGGRITSLSGSTKLEWS